MMIFEPDEDGYYARVGPARVRRGVALLLIYALAALLLYLAFNSLASGFATLTLVAIAAVTLWVGEKMRNSTHGEILLNDTSVIHSDGTVLAELSEIESVTRGAFAMKPSNGFTLVLKTSQPRAWRPGLWWRLGRRVGIGGVVSAGAAKFMAEQIAIRVATRDQT